MDGGQAVLEHHHDGQVIGSVHELYQEAGEDGQEVADGQDKTCSGAVIAL